jgi:hypothetical protein
MYVPPSMSLQLTTTLESVRKTEENGPGRILTEGTLVGPTPVTLGQAQG